MIIGLIKTLAVPLLFFAVIDAFLRTHIPLRSGLILLAITLTNGALAIAIGLTLSSLPAHFMSSASAPMRSGGMAANILGYDAAKSSRSLANSA